MTLTKMQELDVRKIHNEISQIVNQRFMLTTSSFVVFTAVIGWLINKIEHNSLSDLVLASNISVFLMSILFVIFIYFYLLINMMRIYTTYLKIAYSDKWEDDWYKFRFDKFNGKRNRYFGYSKIGAVSFSLLVAVSFILPCIFVLTSPATLGNNMVEVGTLFQNEAFIFSFIIFIVCEIMIWGLTLCRNLIFNGRKKEVLWKQVIRN